MTIDMNGHGVCGNGVYISALAASESSDVLTSDTMPTISRTPHLSAPTVARLPSGSSFGQYFRAIVSLMTSTGGACSSSRSVKPRPRTTRMPIVEK